MERLTQEDTQKLAQASIEIRENLQYLKNKALTAEQLNRMNKARRAFHKANKENQAGFDIVDGIYA